MVLGPFSCFSFQVRLLGLVRLSSAKSFLWSLWQSKPYTTPTSRAFHYNQGQGSDKNQLQYQKSISKDNINFKNNINSKGNCKNQFQNFHHQSSIFQPKNLATQPLSS
jgi:hypothetical protein